MDKIQAKLDAAVAEREAVEATNANLAQNKAGLAGEVEGMAKRGTDLALFITVFSFG